MTAHQNTLPALIPAIPASTLSGPGEKWEVTPELRQILCLTDDHVLHIVDGYAADPFVLGYMERLKRAGFRHESNYVTPEELKSLYRGAAPVSTGERSYQVYSGRDSSETSSRQHQVVEILRNATQSGASDIHIFATPNGHVLRQRVHGELETVHSFAGTDGLKLLSTIYSSMSESTDTSYRPDDTQGGRLRSSFVTECGLFGARIETRPSLHGPWMAMRLLYDSGKLISLDNMGYLDEQIAVLTRFIHRTDGMVLLTGTTGSGKSTSIQTLLKLLLEAMSGINLVTVEDPIEYKIDGAQQTPLKGTWADAIANLMRLDPDVIMSGEIRDILSALAAFQAALTGHGFWSTLHVNSAAASLQRLADLGVDLNLLLDPSLVKGLVNQSLTRVLCNHCKTPYLESRDSISIDLRQRVEARCIPEQVFLKGRGCSHCNNRGVTGRTAIAEIIQPDLAFMRIFREKGKADAQAFWVNEQGGITKNAHLLRRINQGLVDPFIGERDVCALDEDVMTVGAKA